MSRVVDRGAIFAGWVGVGMAAVIVLSFELVVPLQSVVFLMAPLAGLLIGYYANARFHDPATPWRRILANGLYAGLVTGVALAVMYVGVRLLFVYADDGYRIASQGGQIACSTGPDCTYHRYLDDPPSAAQLRAAGVTDAASFQSYYLRQQLDGALVLVVLVGIGGILGAAGYGASRPRTASTPEARPSA